MYGSSASKEYGKGGTVNAMDESSGMKFFLDLSGPSAANKLAPNFSAPSRAAPAILPATSKSLRFTKNFPARRADDDAWELYVPALLTLNCGRDKIPGAQRFPLLGCARAPNGQIQQSQDHRTPRGFAGSW